MMLCIVMAGWTSAVGLDFMQNGDGRFVYVFFGTFCWLYYRGGKKVFDKHYTGNVKKYYRQHYDFWGNVTYEEEIDSELETKGGFSYHYVIAAIVLWALSKFVGSFFPLIHYVIPAIIFILNIISFFRKEKHDTFDCDEEDLVD